MVHFPPLPSRAYVFSSGFSGISQRGFPHSEIPGSKRVCRSPRLIAAYRVLHRLLAPRHSPYALSSLTVEIESDVPASVCIHLAATTNPLILTRTACSNEKLPLQDIQLSKSELVENLVENTGLEPVTSWLQTRRSPS